MTSASVFKFLTKLPAIIIGTMRIVDGVKNATGADKKAAVLAAIPDSVALAEFVVERDLLNDEKVKELLSAAVDAQHAANKAWDALRDVVVKKVPQ